jgi:parallel beta-helix repeat protein
MKSKINKLMAIGVALLFFHLSIATATGVIQTSNLQIEKEKRYQKTEIGNPDLYIPHFPIYILGDRGFKRWKGIIDGSGTENDPYIISGWNIRGNIFWKMIYKISILRGWYRMPICGIYIQNTDKHVIIRNNYIHRWSGESRGYPNPNICGIRVKDATNITIENNIIENNLEGIHCWGGEPLIRFNEISSNKYGIVCDESSANIIHNNISKNREGIECRYSNAYIAFNNIFSNIKYGIWSLASDSSTIENNSIYGNTNGIACGFPTGYPRRTNSTIVNNTIFSNTFGIEIMGGHPTVANNTISSNLYGVHAGGGWTSSSLIIDNVISSNYERGIEVYGNSTIAHNLITSNGCGIVVINPFSTTTISNNIISNQGTGIHCVAGDPIIHYNNIEGNGYGARNLGSEEINATLNWWGALNGPSGAGPGSGDKVSEHIDYDPWLTEPNPNAGPR